MFYRPRKSCNINMKMSKVNGRVKVDCTIKQGDETMDSFEVEASNQGMAIQLTQMAMSILEKRY